MANKPFNFGTTIPTAVGPYAPTDAKDDQTAPAGAVPQAVTSAWDTYRSVLGITVPANVTRQKAATARLMGIVR